MALGKLSRGLQLLVLHREMTASMPPVLSEPKEMSYHADEVREAVTDSEFSSKKSLHAVAWQRRKASKGCRQAEAHSVDSLLLAGLS